jgi:hypothetical protein
MVRAVFTLHPNEVRPKPAARIQALCYRLVYSPWFEPGMLVLVCANVALMAAQFYGQSARAEQGAHRCWDNSFTIRFHWEACTLWKRGPFAVATQSGRPVHRSSWLFAKQ